MGAAVANGSGAQAQVVVLECVTPTTTNCDIAHWASHLLHTIKRTRALANKRTCRRQEVHSCQGAVCGGQAGPQAGAQPQRLRHHSGEGAEEGVGGGGRELWAVEGAGWGGGRCGGGGGRCGGGGRKGQQGAGAEGGGGWREGREGRVKPSVHAMAGACRASCRTPVSIIVHNLQPPPAPFRHPANTQPGEEGEEGRKKKKQKKDAEGDEEMEEVGAVDEVEELNMAGANQRAGTAREGPVDS